MGSSKGYFKANSILESVIALCIISIGLTVAVMVFSQVFNPKNSRQYASENKANSLFYMLQTNRDSVHLENYAPGLKINETALEDRLFEISIEYTDSSKYIHKKNFYIQYE
jgi:type II secretory pathway component PulJ